MPLNTLRTVTFNASKHINYVPPTKIYSMEEIGKPNHGVSSTAVSEPFPLFTEEAIKQIRAEVLSEPVLENCKYSSNLAPCQLRGMAPKYAPFTYDAWRSEEVLSIVSKVAGIELIPVMDYEIGHVNISFNKEEEYECGQNEKSVVESAVGSEEDEAIVDWHTDSYPFVCVLMLSDCREMIGGETALKMGSGEMMKVRGPGMGDAVFLQGRYIEHRALRAVGGKERITMVTSFRPKNPLIRDDTILATVRSVSDLSQLYGQYAEYRLEVLEERIRHGLRKLRERKKAYHRFDTPNFKKFVATQKEFLDSMLNQIVDEDKVNKGYTDDSHL